MIDWDGLVLGPVMDIFAQPIAVTPVVSQPGVAPYLAQGVYKADPVSIPQDDGSVIASTAYTLGIRLADYAVPMVPDDQIAVAGMNWLLDRAHPDGQGGAIWTLKRIS